MMLVPFSIFKINYLNNLDEKNKKNLKNLENSHIQEYEIPLNFILHSILFVFINKFVF